MKLRSTIVLTLLLANYLVDAQGGNWRTVSGKLISNGEPMVGEPIRILGTAHGTITDTKGEFCIIAPSDEIVFISVPKCFEKVVRKLDISTTAVTVKLNKRNSTITDKAQKDWEQLRDQLGPKLLDLFAKVDYQDQRAKICR